MKIQSFILALCLTLLYSCDEEVTEHIYFDAPLSDTSQWVLNYQNYQLNMTMVAVLYQDGKAVGEDAKLLGAFNGTTVRGLAESYIHNNSQLYNILILSNKEEEYIQFGVYLYGHQKAVICTDSVLFKSGSHLGDPDNPYVLNIK